jgi:predicted N-acyltransferase
MAVRGTLADAALALAERLGVSSLHWLFSPEEEARWLTSRGLLRRVGCQFHWTRDGCANFDAFLETLTAEKRKKIRRERRRVAEAGIRFRLLDGRTAGEGDWDLFHELYVDTFDRRGGTPTLSAGFFKRLAEAAPESVLLVLACDGPRPVAAAFCLVGSDCLYGRHWGCRETYHSLHFETCYYQGLEYCLERGLDRFEPGAQGEHKVSRGFLPTRTWSTHWIADDRFRAGIARFLHLETAAMADYCAEMATHSPYRQTDGSTGAT